MCQKKNRLSKKHFFRKVLRLARHLSCASHGVRNTCHAPFPRTPPFATHACCLQLSRAHTQSMSVSSKKTPSFAHLPLSLSRYHTYSLSLSVSIALFSFCVLITYTQLLSLFLFFLSLLNAFVMHMTSFITLSQI